LSVGCITTWLCIETSVERTFIAKAYSLKVLPTKKYYIICHLILSTFQMINFITFAVIICLPISFSHPIPLKQEIAKYLLEQMQIFFYEDIKKKLLNLGKQLYQFEISLPSVLGFLMICFVLLFIRCFNEILIRIEKLEEDRNEQINKSYYHLYFIIIIVIFYNIFLCFTTCL